MKAWKTLAIAALVVTALGAAPTSTSAAPIFFDDFTQEEYGLNTSLYNWTVAGGTIDVVGDPGFYPGLCTGGPSADKCVDLDGSSSNAGLIASIGISLGPGQYAFSYWLKGNSRGGSQDTVRVNVQTGITAGTSHTLASGDPWQQFTEIFTVAGSQTANLVFDHAGGDNVGILLDNVSLTAVPEPATLTLLGLGLAAVRLRRRVR